MSTTPHPKPRMITRSMLGEVTAERDAAVARAEQLDKKLAKVMSDYQDVEDERDGWKARAEQAERERDIAETYRRTVEQQAAIVGMTPPVSRAEVEKAIKGELVGSNITLPDNLFELQIDAVCALFGVEAEQAVDPVEERARELAAAGGIDFDEQEPDGVEMLFGMARYVLGKEADAWDKGQEVGINDDLGDWEVAPSITTNPYRQEADQ